MGINHRGRNIGMTKQFLYGADIITGGEDMAGVEANPDFLRETRRIPDIGELLKAAAEPGNAGLCRSRRPADPAPRLGGRRRAGGVRPGAVLLERAVRPADPIPRSGE